MLSWKCSVLVSFVCPTTGPMTGKPLLFTLLHFTIFLVLSSLRGEALPQRTEQYFRQDTLLLEPHLVCFYFNRLVCFLLAKRFHHIYHGTDRNSVKSTCTVIQKPEKKGQPSNYVPNGTLYWFIMDSEVYNRFGSLQQIRKFTTLRL